MLILNQTFQGVIFASIALAMVTPAGSLVCRLLRVRPPRILELPAWLGLAGICLAAAAVAGFETVAEASKARVDFLQVAAGGGLAFVALFAGGALLLTAWETAFRNEVSSD